MVLATRTGRLAVAAVLGTGAAAMALARRERRAGPDQARELVLEARLERMRAARHELLAAHEGDQPA
jgi:hypothetical protein